jgi:cobalamin biosynthesis Co2+ chelatase CbiK
MVSCRALLSSALSSIICEVIMSELDPVTFLIATELLAASNSTSSHRQASLTRPHTTSSPTLILVAQGDENESGSSDPFEDLSLRAQRDFGADSVRIAYLHSDSPSLSDVVEDLLSRRIHRVRVLPLFLSEADLAASEIALEIHDLQEKYAALEIELLPAIGEDARFRRLLWQMVRERALPDWLAKTS